MKTVRAIFEDEVFRPTEHVELPEHSLVEFEPRPVEQDEKSQALDAIYEALSRRSDGGSPDLAAHHDEHQP